jgi:uncharacterized membrane protein
MKENVGTTERMLSAVAGPALLAVGYDRLGGKDGDLAGLATMITGALLVERAITKVCPTKAALGIGQH